MAGAAARRYNDLIAYRRDACCDCLLEVIGDFLVISSNKTIYNQLKQVANNNRYLHPRIKIAHVSHVCKFLHSSTDKLRYCATHLHPIIVCLVDNKSDAYYFQRNSVARVILQRLRVEKRLVLVARDMEKVAESKNIEEFIKYNHDDIFKVVNWHDFVNPEYLRDLVRSSEALKASMVARRLQLLQSVIKLKLADPRPPPPADFNLEDSAAFCLSYTDNESYADPKLAPVDLQDFEACTMKCAKLSSGTKNLPNNETPNRRKRTVSERCPRGRNEDTDDEAVESLSDCEEKDLEVEEAMFSQRRQVKKYRATGALLRHI